MYLQGHGGDAEVPESVPFLPVGSFEPGGSRFLPKARRISCQPVSSWPPRQAFSTSTATLLACPLGSNRSTGHRCGRRCAERDRCAAPGRRPPSPHEAGSGASLSRAGSRQLPTLVPPALCRLPCCASILVCQFHTLNPPLSNRARWTEGDLWPKLLWLSRPFVVHSALLWLSSQLGNDDAKPD
jgi:hypothetical protein